MDPLADLSVRMKHYRALDKRSFRKIQIKQMNALHAIYSREVHVNIPESLKIIKDTVSVGPFSYDCLVAFRQVKEDYFEPKYWEGLMDAKNGPFRPDSEQIIRKICAYQKIKATQHISEGFITFPEMLFCEEIKVWVTETLCMLGFSNQERNIIVRRIRYLEEVLSATNLFEPLLTAKSTVQQAIVAVRQILKYRVLPLMDKELAHFDARKSLDSLKIHVASLTKEIIDFLYHVFKKSTSPQIDHTIDLEVLLNLSVNDTCLNILKSLIRSPEIMETLWPGRQDKILGASKEPPGSQIIGNQQEQVPAQSSFIEVELNGFISLAKGLLPKTEVPTSLASEARDWHNLVILREKHYHNLFRGEVSGMEEAFRANEVVAVNFLSTVGLTKELGGLYSVIDKAAHCASQGGTLLVFGIANSQMNLILATCNDLIASLRRFITNLFMLAEGRFEELVYLNKAVVEKNDWVFHYKTLNSTLTKIDKLMKVISEGVLEIKTKANSLTLYEQFQKAREDTTIFLQESENFSKNMARLLGKTYSSPPLPAIVNLPDMNTIEGLTRREGLKVIEYKPTPPLKDSPQNPVFVDLARSLTTIHNNSGNEIAVHKPFVVNDQDFVDKDTVGEGVSELRGTLPLSHWYYLEDSIWKAYSNELSTKIETSWLNFEAGIISIGNDIAINLSTMEEVPSAFYKWNKKIVRGTWFWQDSDKDGNPTTWVPYEPEIAAKLENRATKYALFTIKITDIPPRYVIRESDGTFRQFRTSSHANRQGRPVRRGFEGKVLTLEDYKAPIVPKATFKRTQQ